MLAVASGAVKERLRDLQQLIPGKLMIFRMDSMQDLHSLIEILGRLTQKRQRAKQIVERMNIRLNRLQMATRNITAPKALFLVGCDPHVGAGQGTYLMNGCSLRARKTSWPILLVIQV